MNSMHRDLTFNSVIAFARDLVRIPSFSGDEGAAAKRVVSELKLLRFDEVWTDEIGNVMAHVKGKGRAPSIMLSSHLDVVEAGELAAWEHPPFGGEIAGGSLHGRGSLDCKGPLALQSYAAASLLNSRPEGDVYLVHTVLEERGSWGMSHAIQHLGDRPAAVVLGEATAGDICIGHRGRIELTIVIRGKSAHASAPQCGCNPVHLLPTVLTALQRFAASLSAHAVLSRPSLVPSQIETRPNSRNMVPEEVRVVIDWRTVPGEGEHDSVDALRTFVQDQLRAEIDPPSDGLKIMIEEAAETQRSYTGLECTGPISTAGFLLPPHHSIVQGAVGAVHAATGRIPAVRPWGFGTDGSYSCGVYGIPTIGYAPGDETMAHTNRERLELDSARTVYDAYPLLIRQLQKACASDTATEARPNSAADHLFLQRLKPV
jgi:succinyl-diaminopimelate desuccinylase